MNSFILWLSDNAVAISSIVILGVFVYFLCFELIKRVRSVNRLLLKLSQQEDLIGALQGTELESYGTAFKKTINIETPEGEKTNVPAASVFNEVNVAMAFKINLRMLDAASGILVGLGLLGTFLGLTIGVSGFDSTDSANIQKSIQNLLGGMSTAFLTSLLGMACSLIYSTFDKRWRNKYRKHLFVFTEKLDSLYYIEDNTLNDYRRKQLLEDIKIEIESKFTYELENGKTTIANAIREILQENREQSKALKSFSTDLAMQLNDSFGQVLSHEMEEKILPLLTSVDSTTKMVIEHIDKMASTVASPASSLMDSVVEELKTSMISIVSEFKTSLSGSAVSQMESLAEQLGAASSTMSSLPAVIHDVTNRLDSTMKDVTSAVKENVKTITDDVTNKQTDMLSMQQQSMTQSKNLLDTFNLVIDRMTKANENLTGSMSEFSQAQGEIYTSTKNLKAISDGLMNATETFMNGQDSFAEKIRLWQENSQSSIDQVMKLLTNSGQMSADYAEKFELIKVGLSDIFAQLQKGLTEYSRTVASTTQKYLDEYSSNLTQTTAALSSAIEQQQEVVEMLNETLSNKK